MHITTRFDRFFNAPNARVPKRMPLNELNNLFENGRQSRGKQKPSLFEVNILGTLLFMQPGLAQLLLRLAVGIHIVGSWAVVAQQSVFTYQGRLQSGGFAADGNFDMQFTLHSAPTGSSVVGGPITIAPVQVSNGLFTVQLDFGLGGFDGGARWLEIGIRRYGETNAYVILAPRQRITAAPYSLWTFRALMASNLTGVVQATNLVGTLPDSVLSTNVALLDRSVTFAGTVRASGFVGNGAGLTNVPGRVFDAIPIGSATQAQPNTWYLATNDAVAVVVTLPQSAALKVGETIRVSASGAAGWIIRQNAGQVIYVGNLLDNVGARWTARETTRNWRGVAASADGRTIVAVVYGGQIYVSTNYGVGWTAYGYSRNWQAVASSADGKKLVAVVSGGQIYTSGDGGVSWTVRENNRNWSGVASSLDGVNLVATVNGGQIYTSYNSGQSWTARESARAWVAVACSANGSNLVAAAYGGQIYISTNAGVTWTARGPTRNWVAVACSADGSRMIAAVPSDTLYLSMDGGASWAQAAASPLLQWTAVACSADGTRMAAVHSPGGIYVSTDSGNSWAIRTGAPSDIAWTCVAVSGDGSTIAAVPSNGQIYVSSQATTTPGTAGYIAGMRLSAIELQYIGNGQFIPISRVGTIAVY